MKRGMGILLTILVILAIVILVVFVMNKNSSGKVEGFGIEQDALGTLFATEQELSAIAAQALTIAPPTVMVGEINELIPVGVPMELENEVYEVYRNYNISDTGGNSVMLRETLAIAKTERARLALTDLVGSVGGQSESIQIEKIGDKSAAYMVNGGYFVQFMKENVMVQLECVSQNPGYCSAIEIAEAKRISAKI